MVTQISSLTQTLLKTVPTAAHLGGKPHIAIFGSGVKPRHTYFARALSQESGIARIPCDKDAARPSVGARLTEAANAVNSDEALTVLLDVSCLSRPTITDAFAAIHLIAMHRPVSLRVAYSIATYAPSPVVWAKPVRTICPVHPMFSGWTAEGASPPLDVVVGLGYERGKALGAVEYLEPRNRWICIPNSPHEAYLDEVMRHNKPLIGNSKGRIINYDVLFPLDTFHSLRSLVEGIAREARPVLLPFGPKIFFAISLLVAMSIEEAAVWHVSGESDDYSERSPSRFSTVLGCVLDASNRDSSVRS